MWEHFIETALSSQYLRLEQFLYYAMRMHSDQVVKRDSMLEVLNEKEKEKENSKTQHTHDKMEMNPYERSTSLGIDANENICTDSEKSGEWKSSTKESSQQQLVTLVHDMFKCFKRTTETYSMENKIHAKKQQENRRSVWHLHTSGISLTATMRRDLKISHRINYV